MLNVHDGLVQLKITCATCSFFAVCSTLYRLWVRRGRMWIDDATAAFALLTLVIQIVSVFLHLPVPNSQPKTTRVAAYYLMAYTFYTVIFSSRLSILFSIIRIDPSERRRRMLYGAGIFMLASLLFLMAQLLWVCEPAPHWKDAANPQCHLPLQVAVCQLVTDVIADGILLVAPLTLLRHLADKSLRRKLGIIFSTCVLTTIVSLVHAAYILSNGGIKVVISAIVEDTCSLIVANIPVVVTATFALSTEEDRVRTFQTTSMKFNSMSAFRPSRLTSRGITTKTTGTLTATIAMDGIPETDSDGYVRSHTYLGTNKDKVKDVERSSTSMETRDVKSSPGHDSSV